MLRRIFQFFRKSKSQTRGVLVIGSPHGVAFEHIKIRPDGSTRTIMFGSKVGTDAVKPVTTIEHVEK